MSSNFSTFSYRPNERDVNTILSRRPGLVVRFAAIGKLGGEDHFLVGCATDFNHTEASLAYGTVSRTELDAIESKLGATLLEIMDKGIEVQVMSRSRPAPVRLIGIEATPKIETYAKDTARHYMYPYMGDYNEANAKRAHEAGARFAEIMKAALKLRLSVWIITAMKHRADFPIWFPKFCREMIVEHSRPWLELPHAPAGFKAPVLPPPPPADFSTKRPVYPVWPQWWQ